MKKVLLVMAVAISLAGCGTPTGGLPTTLPQIPAGTDQTVQTYINQVQAEAVKICGFLPAATTVASIVASIFGAGEVVGVVSTAAKGICSSVTAKRAVRGQAMTYRGVPIEGQFTRRR